MEQIPETQPRLPLPPSLMMSEEGSFAHLTLTKRMPAIVQRVIAENEFPSAIVENLETLIQELPEGIVRSLKDDRGPDLAAWAGYLAPFLGKRWLDIPWFFGETYFFRRIIEATQYFLSGPSFEVDPYAVQKRRGLETARDSIQAMSARLNNWVKTHQGDRTKSTSLIALLYFDLWGNRADLSLWPVDSVGAGFKPAPTPAQNHVLVDDTAAIAERVASFHQVRIDFVVDNVGLELVSDLCLADFLLASQTARTVCLHLKPYPTFVSDATIEDVHSTLDVLAADSDGEVRSLALRLQNQIAAGRLCLRDHLFWTSPLACWEMPEPLRHELAGSNLVFIKGDANYRRCLGDRHWPFTTSFADIMCYFPAPLVALRTLKSEIVVGLQSIQVEALPHEDPHWLTNGQWGVVQYRD